MFSKQYIVKFTTILTLIIAAHSHAGPMFGNAQGNGNASFGISFGTGASMYGDNRFAPYPYAPRYTPRPQKPASDLQDADFGALEIEEVGDRLRVRVPVNLLFDFDHYDLRPDADYVLQTVARIARSRHAGSIELHGHTDAMGTDEYNQRLSNLRTYRVKHWLITRGGFEAQKVGTQGHGESQPVAPNTYPNGADNPWGRAMNRRVEFII